MQPQPADTPTGYADLTGFSLRITPQRKLTFIIRGAGARRYVARLCTSPQPIGCKVL